MIITTALLRRRGACFEQLARFEQLFPDGIRVTVANCVLHAEEFSWAWATYNLVPGNPTRNLATFERLVKPAEERWLAALRNAVTAADRARTVSLRYDVYRQRATTFARLVRYPHLRTITEER